MDISVDDLVALARSDAPRALQLGRDWLDSQQSSTDHEQRSIVLRALGIAARFASTMDQAVEYGDDSISAADISGNPSLRSWARVTQAGSMGLMGDTDRALTLLDAAVAIGSDEVLGVIHVQRGLIFGMRGESNDALLAFSSAMPFLHETGDQSQLAIALHNRGLLHVLIGELGAAEEDLLKARELHAALGLDHLLSGAEHNLGLLAAYRGDIPEALSRFAASEELEKHQTGSEVPVHASRSEALLSAGLFGEALELATSVYRESERHGRGDDEAEARLVAAHAALFGGDPELASELAATAGEMFAAQGRSGWVASARRIEIQSKFESGSSDTELLGQAIEVADQLQGGLAIPAHNARLLAGLVALDIGAIDVAERELGKVAEIRSGPVEVRLLGQYAKARLRFGLGDRRGADAAARAGFRILDNYQAALGASDIRSGIERHSIALGTLGLDLAIQSRRARRAFTWMEMTRARSLRYRPVTPSDSEHVEELARLRKLAADMRQAAMPIAPKVTREIKFLQDAIRDRAHRARADGMPSKGSFPEDAWAALGDRTLVEFASVGGMLWAVVIRDGRFRLRQVGPEEDLLEQLERMRFTFRRLARRRGSTTGSAEEAARLDRALFGSLSLGGGGLVIIPTAPLQVIPWCALPTIRGREVIVSPSAHLWHRASGRAAAQGREFMAAGPDLDFSDAEVNDISMLYARPTILRSNESMVDAVRANLEGARLAHIASHAFFQHENPMFSALRLADGDLYVYDIERLKAAPGIVVLSACDSGFTETRAGEELMGLSSALLSMGTRSIIASVGLVPDSEATKELMVELHRGLASGKSPSVALHEAQQRVADTPEGYVAACSFICIGAG